LKTKLLGQEDVTHRACNESSYMRLIADEGNKLSFVHRLFIIGGISTSQIKLTSYMRVKSFVFPATFLIFSHIMI
jgi:hypothetical protein